MTRDEIIAQMTILVDRAFEEGCHAGYLMAKEEEYA
jgi:hypothetical protein